MRAVIFARDPEYIGLLDGGGGCLSPEENGRGDGRGGSSQEPSTGDLLTHWVQYCNAVCWKRKGDAWGRKGSSIKLTGFRTNLRISLMEGDCNPPFPRNTGID